MWGRSRARVGKHGQCGDGRIRPSREGEAERPRPQTQIFFADRPVDFNSPEGSLRSAGSAPHSPLIP